MTKDDLQALLRTGIQAAQSGSPESARTILQRVVEQAPDNELGWIWLATVADSLAERRACLQQVLRINPENARAQKALEQLPAVDAAEAPPAPEPSPRPQPPTARAVRSPERAAGPVFDREALLEATEAPPERRFSRALFLLVSILAIVLVAIGSYLIWGEVDGERDDAPGAGAGPVAANGTDSVEGASSTRPPTATRGPTATVPTLPPTWTPLPAATDPPTGTPLPTPLPLSRYTLVYAGIRGFDFHWSLYRVSADGSSESRLAASLTTVDSEVWRLTDILEPSLSPDGSQLAVTARLETRPAASEDGAETESLPEPRVFQEICLMPVEGGVLDCLTAFGVEDTGAASWAPDGTQLVFESPVDGDFEIYTVAVEGDEDADPVPLTRNTYDDRDPAWSPDGATIVYASEEDGPGQLEIWRMETDGSGRERLTNAANSSFGPAWSPDGERIVFVSNREVDLDVYVMDADGFGEHLLTRGDEAVSDRDPAWSVDGEWIVFSGKPENGAYNLTVIRPDGDERQVIVAGSGDSRFAVWLP